MIMKRIGMFTGKIYDENVDVSTIEECCVMCGNPTEKDIARAKLKCILCPGDKNCMKGKS